MTAIDTRDKAAVDQGPIKEKQRRFAAIQGTVRGIQTSGEDRKPRLARTNLGKPFPRDGSAPYILFHVMPRNEDAYFQLQGSTVPGDYGTETQLLALIEDRFKLSNGEPFFVVRRGRLGFSHEATERYGTGEELGVQKRWKPC